MKRRHLACAAGLSVVAAGLLAAAPASAATVSDASADDGTVITQPMYVAGYDAEVAAANGFKVTTDANGKQQSIPVTAQAKAIVAKSLSVRSSTGVTPQGYAVVYGDCGSSWIRLVKGGSDILTIKTGYTVQLPQTYRSWGVVGAGVPGGGFNVPFNGKSNPIKSWSGTTGIRFVGPGAGHVAIGSHIQQIDGKICYSGNPGTGFD